MSKAKRYWLRSPTGLSDLWWIWDGDTGSCVATFEDEAVAKAELKRMNSALLTPPPVTEEL